MPSTMDNVPDETYLAILRLVSVFDRTRLRQLNRRTKNVLDEDGEHILQVEVAKKGLMPQYGSETAPLHHRRTTLAQHTGQSQHGATAQVLALTTKDVHITQYKARQGILSCIVQPSTKGRANTSSLLLYKLIAVAGGSTSHTPFLRIDTTNRRVHEYRVDVANDLLVLFYERTDEPGWMIDVLQLSSGLPHPLVTSTTTYELFTPDPVARDKPSRIDVYGELLSVRIVTSSGDTRIVVLDWTVGIESAFYASNFKHIADVMVLTGKLILILDEAGILDLVSIHRDEHGRLALGQCGHRLRMPDDQLPYGCGFVNARLYYDHHRTKPAGNGSNPFLSSDHWLQDPDEGLYVVCLEFEDKKGRGGLMTIIGTLQGLRRVAAENFGNHDNGSPYPSLAIAVNSGHPPFDCALLWMSSTWDSWCIDNAIIVSDQIPQLRSICNGVVAGRAVDWYYGYGNQGERALRTTLRQERNPAGESNFILGVRDTTRPIYLHQGACIMLQADVGYVYVKVSVTSDNPMPDYSLEMLPGADITRRAERNAEAAQRHREHVTTIPTKPSARARMTS
ncbi:unnamed protein product [Peniophora sp. CBMAI 1063]|nr:unnamed protein product [Peniophora sp. CBMAI 1063]